MSGSSGRPLSILPALANASASGEMFRPSNGSSGDDTGPQTPGSNSSQKKRTLIESACAGCRKRKSRCDGMRPRCSRCNTLQTDCVYEAEEGESRWQALRRRTQILEAERTEVRELLQFLQMRPESEALEIFKRIRTTTHEDVLDVLRAVRDNGLQSSDRLRQSSVTSSNGETTLPGIQTMFEGADVLRQQHGAVAPGPHGPHPMRQGSHSTIGSTNSSSAHSVGPYTRPW